MKVNYKNKNEYMNSSIANTLKQCNMISPFLYYEIEEGNAMRFAKKQERLCEQGYTVNKFKNVNKFSIS